MTKQEREEPNEEVTASYTVKGPKCYVPKRYIFTFMSFGGFLIFSCQYTNMSFTIVAMVNLTAFAINRTLSDECPAATEYEIEQKKGSIEWPPHIVGVILAAIAIGCLTTKIPGGRFGERFSCKKLIAITVIFSSLMTLLVPVTAQWGMYPEIILRFLTGLFLGPVLPDVIYMVGLWIPNCEKNLHMAVIVSGISLGTTLCPIIFASLCDSDFLGGWPSVFYVSGFVGLGWVLLWNFLISDTPYQHSTISDQELRYIRDNLSHKKKCWTIPWMKLLASIPYWAMLSGYLSFYWFIGFFATVHSLYLGSILHMTVAKNGLYSALPRVFRVVFQWLGAYLSHWILGKKLISADVLAKSWVTINALLASVSFLGITLVGCNETLITIFFAMSYLGNGIAEVELRTAASNMAPALSGTISGIAECVGGSTYFIIPAIVGWLTEHEQTMSQWNKMFYINIAAIASTSLFFVLFGTSEEQPWAAQPKVEEDGSDSAENKTKK